MTSKVSLIVAMDRNRVIGVDNKLPWHLPADLKRFRELTMGHHIIMGRKTYESIGKPLPGRTMVIVTRQKDFGADSTCKIAHGLSEALQIATGDTEPFIIGGANLYGQSLAVASKIYLTFVETECARGDAFFPPLDTREWQLSEEHVFDPDEKNRFPYRFQVWTRKKQEAGHEVPTRGGKNPYVKEQGTPGPKRKFTITYLPHGVAHGVAQGFVVEVDSENVPTSGTGLPGSILDIGLASGADIDHACGGVCACSTCHVVVKEGLESCSKATEEEEDQLDKAPGVTTKSRLACQTVPDGTKNVVVEIPNWNRNLVRE